MSWRWWLAVVALVAAGCSDPSDDPAVDGTQGAVSPPPATVAPPEATARSTPSTATAGAASTTPPVISVEPTDAPATTGVVPDGFELVAGRVIAADGRTCDVCLWLAATPEQRGRGLMGVTDLGAGDGMVFRWDEATTGNFWMRDTPQALSIAFFAADGSFVSATDMDPCLQPTPDAECPRYAAAGAYTYAVEVFTGGLPPLLIGPGSRLDLLGDSCPGTT